MAALGLYILLTFNVLYLMESTSKQTVTVTIPLDAVQCKKKDCRDESNESSKYPLLLLYHSMNCANDDEKKTIISNKRRGDSDDSGEIHLLSKNSFPKKG